MADAVYAACLCTGLVLWGLGLLWYILGMTIFLRHALVTDKTYLLPSKFTLALYATTFPIGVLATGAYIIAQELNSEAMRVIGAFLALQVTFSWVWVFVGNVNGIRMGSVWKAPELAGAVAEKRGARVSDVEKQ
jgi:tellurite resistance protein TehA-like permease